MLSHVTTQLTRPKSQTVQAVILCAIASMVASLIVILLVMNHELAHLEQAHSASRQALAEANRRLVAAGQPTVPCTG